MPISMDIARTACPIVLWGFTVASVLSDPEFASLPRDLDVVELWSGVHSLGLACRARGLRAQPFDKKRSDGVTGVSEDILTRDGFLNALRLVMRLIIGGLLWEAPVCASMGFPNSSNCKRTADNPFGATAYVPVQEGNKMANISCFFFVMAAARGVHAAIENPPPSWIWRLPFMEKALSTLKASWGLATRCAYSDAPPGKRYNKPYRFAAIGEIDMSSSGERVPHGHGDWVLDVAGKCTCPVVHTLTNTGKRQWKRQHVPLMPTNKKGASCGNLSRMQDSAGYPPRMGAAIICAWSRVPCRDLENKPSKSNMRLHGDSAVEPEVSQESGASQESVASQEFEEGQVSQGSQASQGFCPLEEASQGCSSDAETSPCKEDTMQGHVSQGHCPPEEAPSDLESSPACSCLGEEESSQGCLADENIFEKQVSHGCCPPDEAQSDNEGENAVAGLCPSDVEDEVGDFVDHDPECHPGATSGYGPPEESDGSQVESQASQMESQLESQSSQVESQLDEYTLPNEIRNPCPPTSYER